MVVVDVGSGHPMRKLRGHLLDLAREARLYCAIEYGAECRPTVIGDAHSLPIKDCSADAVICKTVLEHVKCPQLVVDEIHRILKSNGRLYINAPFIYAYHAPPGKFEDYWRFTHSGLRYSLRQFSEVKIEPLGGIMTAFLLMTRFNRFTKLTQIADRIIKTEVTSNWYVEAVK